MRVIKDIDKINFEFSGTCSVNTASIDNNRYDNRYNNRYKVKSIDELYDVLTSEAIFKIMLTEFSMEIKSLSDVDYNDWDMYDQIAFIIGMEKYYEVDISDQIADGFTLGNVIPRLKRDNALNNLGI